MSNRIRTLSLAALLLGSLWIAACGSSGEDVTLGTSVQNSGEESVDTTADPAAIPSAGGKVWTVAEVLSEPRRGGGGGEPRCGGEGGFKRCICPENVPEDIRYRPALAECNNRAAMIFSGRYASIFSAVVRDSQNADRFPPAGSGFGGCSAALASSESPPNSCSAFKVQEKFEIAGNTEVHCLGESGYSSIFADVTRITVKLNDVPTSSNDEIERFCIFGPSRPLN